MTADESRRTIGLLETLGGELAELRGENRASHVSIDRRFDALSADLDSLRSAQAQQGLRLAALPCDRHAESLGHHARRISEAVRHLALADKTGQIELARDDARSAALRSVGRVALGVFAALGAVGTLIGALWAAVR